MSKREPLSFFSENHCEQHSTILFSYFSLFLPKLSYLCWLKTYPHMIDRPTIDRIMDAADIVDVISDFVSLRKRGTSYKGLCPFHDDRTPSFSVSPAKGVYKCFSCGKAGNVVNFIMEHEQMTYPDALKWLANKYHIEVKEKELTPEEKAAQTERESLFIVNEWAVKFFQEQMNDTEEGKTIGLRYFRERGFRDDVIQRFQLGFSPSNRHALADEAKKKGYKTEFLTKTGLCGQREDGSLYDRFSGRVIFPWIGVGGKVTAFGGRLLDARTKGVSQKYVNSPDSDIYHKDHELYGIFQAKKAIVKEDCVYMVEGYTDVISMHQCGIENVVANSGTALSLFQIKLLRRFTQNIVLLYDGDEAGIHAALRGTDMFLAEAMNVKVLLLPNQEDPDSFARKHTAEEFRQYIEQHQTDFIEFKTNVTLRGVTDPFKRSQAISGIIKSISVIPDPIVRATYVQDCARRIGYDERTLIAQMNKFIHSEREQRAKEAQRETERKQYQEIPQGTPTIVTVNPPADAMAPSTSTVPTSTSPASPTALTPRTPIAHVDKKQQLERMMVEMVVRYGEQVIYRDVKNEADGSSMNITLAQYLYYDLSADEMTLENPIYARILVEAVDHAGDDNFKAEAFFTKHSDFEVSTAAAELCSDSVQLTKSLQMNHDEEFLRSQAVHLVLDYKLNRIEKQLVQLRQYLAEVQNQSDKLMAVLAEIRKEEDLRNKIAKKLGNNIR